jgi:hypothetical protein
MLKKLYYDLGVLVPLWLKCYKNQLLSKCENRMVNVPLPCVADLNTVE